MSSPLSTASQAPDAAAIRRQFFKFAIPAALGMLVNSFYVIADGIFISRGVGSVGLAAVNIGYPIINLTAALSLMFGAGGATLIALHSQDTEYKNKCFTYTIALNLLVYLLVAGTVFLFPDPIIFAFGGNEKLLPMVKEYLFPCVIASFFLMLATSLNAIVRNDGAPQRAMHSLFIGAIANIVLDYLFIFEFNMGILGGAYATAIGQILSAVYLCLHFPRSTFRFVFQFEKRDWIIPSKILSIGFSSFILEFAVMVITVLINVSLARMEGERGMAAYGIISYAFVIYRMFFTGLAQGIQPLISLNYGLKRFQTVLHTYRFAQQFCLLMTTLSLLAAYFGAEAMVRVFTNEESMIPYASEGLFLYSSAIIFVGANFMNISYLQAMDKAHLANMISIARGIIYMMVALYLLPQYWGVKGIWLALPVADVLTTLTTMLIFQKFKINKTLQQQVAVAA